MVGAAVVGAVVVVEGSGDVVTPVGVGPETRFQESLTRRAAVELVDLVRVDLGEAGALPNSRLLLRHDGRLPIAREGARAVMHDASIVVLAAESLDRALSVLLELP